ncbi:MAG: hypothetical protein ACLP5H_02860 [Desulfomonilaceae bacterium]
MTETNEVDVKIEEVSQLVTKVEVSNVKIPRYYGVAALIAASALAALAVLALFICLRPLLADPDTDKAPCLQIATNASGSEPLPATITNRSGHSQDEICDNELVICDVILKNVGTAKASYPFIKLYINSKPKSGGNSHSKLQSCGEADYRYKDRVLYDYEAYTIPEHSLVTSIPAGVSMHRPLRFLIQSSLAEATRGAEYKACLKLYYEDKESRPFHVRILLRGDCKTNRSPK